MKTKFRPYLDIKNNNTLKILLERQKSIDENYYDFSWIDTFSDEEIERALKGVKDYYSYTAKSTEQEFIDDVIRHLIKTQYLYLVVTMKLFEDDEQEEVLKNIHFNIYDAILKETIQINEFIIKYFGENFFQLHTNRDGKLQILTNEKLIAIVNKMRTVVAIIALNHNSFRLRTLMYNILYFKFPEIDGNK